VPGGHWSGAGVQRVNTAMMQWEEVAANATLPVVLRRVVEPPRLNPAALRELRSMLIGELHELEKERELQRV
jgi:hypothetical protein